MAQAEIGILDWIQQAMQCPFLDKLMPIITMLGDAGIFWMLCAAVLLCIKKTRPLGLAMALALAFDVVLCNGILKPLIARPRPYVVNPAVTLLVETPSDYSFPSGHTAASFASAFALVFSKSRLWIPAMVLAAVIAFSRLYLYVHFPTDILGGIAVGAVCGLIGALLAKKLLAVYRERRMKGRHEQ